VDKDEPRGEKIIPLGNPTADRQTRVEGGEKATRNEGDQHFPKKTASSALRTKGEDESKKEGSSLRKNGNVGRKNGRDENRLNPDNEAFAAESLTEGINP